MSKRDKYVAKSVSMDDVLKELGYVKWPPKYEGEECVCGCKVVDNKMLFCEQHQPYPA